MKTKLFIIKLICWLFLASSCGPGYFDDTSVNAKPVDIFLENELIAEKPYLKLKNAAFGQDFLFYGTFIPMLKSPSGHTLKGRIVRFEKQGDRIVLLESAQGHSISDTQSTILLAEFPIVSTDNDGIVIDFAKGMTSAFVTRNVHAGSGGEKKSDNADQFKAINLNASFIKSIETVHNTLVITQIAQWKTPKSELVSAEFRYYFREYTPSPNFAKKTLGVSRHGQYFSTPAQVLPPTTEVWQYITKWHLNKPIIFYISSNTPSEYFQAIKDGLLFWNNIFGHEVIKVKKLDPGLSAPHPTLNIIQWVPWDNEASAYADMVVDHLTGEIIQAQIYLRSGWVFGSPKKLRAELQRLILSDEKMHEHPAVEEGAPLPSMFDHDELCYHSIQAPEALIELASLVSASEISEATLKIITADILRTVVAHELGHVLGLRHNMASSTAGNISLSERKEALRTYLATGKPPLGADKYLTHSIMDVFSAADDGLLGSQIGEMVRKRDFGNSPLKNIYSYDKQIIDYGYFDKPMLGNTPFCTDDDMKNYLDCRRWDVSPTPTLFAAQRLNSTLTNIAMLMADTFMSALDPERKGGPIPIRDVPLGSANILKNIQLNIVDLFSWFNRNARSIQIDSQFGAHGTHNRALINKARYAYVREQVLKNGIHETLFTLMPPYRSLELEPRQLVKAFSAQLALLIQEANKKHPDLKLSNEQWREAQKIAFDFFTVFNTDLIALFAKTISPMQFDDPEFQLPPEEALGVIAREIILQHTPHTNPPVFRYDVATREAAALLLNPAMGLMPDWSMRSLHAISEDLKNLMRQHGALSGTESINIFKLPRATGQWLLEQNRVLNTLIRVKAMQRPSGETNPDK